MEGLLERERELRECGALLARAQDGHGGVVWIEGPAGIGKSALLRAARERAASKGAATLVGRGSELSRAFPFGVVLALLAPAVRDEVVALRGAAGLAAPLFERGDDAVDELSLMHGLYWVVSDLAERRSLLLLVDDAQWADSSSLRFLLYLSQRIEDLPVVLALARRSGEPADADDLLRGIAARPGTVRLRPAPLSGTATTTMVRDLDLDASDRFCATCHELTGGNPFLLSELLGAARAAGIELDDRGAAALAGVSLDVVGDAVLVRLSRLDPAARELARAAAVLGPEAELRRAASLAGLDRAAAAAAADALVAVEILLPGSPLAFMHPLLRSSVYADVPAATRALMHQAAARLLAAEGAPSAAVAGQLLPATRAGEPWSCGRLRDAAREALAHGAADSAVRYLRRGLEEPPPPELRPALLLELSEAEAAAGDVRAVGRLEEALALIGDAVARAEVHNRLGWTLHKQGRLEEAAEAFAAGLAELEGAGGGEAAVTLRAELRLGYIGAGWQVSSHAGEVRREWTALLERAAAGDVGEGGALVAQLATLRLFHGEPSTEVAAYARAALEDGDLIRREGSDSLTLWHAVGCLSWADELDVAEDVVEQAMEHATGRGLVPTVAQCLYARSWPQLWRGDVDAAAADAGAATEAWRGGWGYYLPAAMYWQAAALLEHGDVDAAEAALELPDAEERWSTTSMFVLWLHGRAAVAVARGDHMGALQHLRRAGRLATEELQIVNPAVMPWRSQSALALSALGRDDEAGDLASEELELARRFGAARPLGAALRAAGLVWRGEAGLRLVEEAVAVLAASPSTLEHIRALIDLGTLLRVGGRRADARVPLREALVLLDGCRGALALRNRAREELRAAGGRIRREAATGLDSLTPTERRVAELAAGGRSNPEIAQTLFVSRKTVEWHLGHVYAKLGLAAREQLAVALADAEVS